MVVKMISPSLPTDDEVEAKKGWQRHCSPAAPVLDLARHTVIIRPNWRFAALLQPQIAQRTDLEWKMLSGEMWTVVVPVLDEVPLFEQFEPVAQAAAAAERRREK